VITLVVSLDYIDSTEWTPLTFGAAHI
jgi:hypothetical protein